MLKQNKYSVFCTKQTKNANKTMSQTKINEPKKQNKTYYNFCSKFLLLRTSASV